MSHVGVKYGWVGERQTMNTVCSCDKKHDVATRLLNRDVYYQRAVEPQTQLVALKIKVQTQFNEIQHIMTCSPEITTWMTQLHSKQHRTRNSCDVTLLLTSSSRETKE